MRTLPRLDDSPAVRSLVTGLAAKDIESCRAGRSVWHPDAWYGPMGGDQLGGDELTAIGDALTVAARCNGYPSTSRADRHTREADIDMAIALYEGLGISPVEASEPGIWNFLAVVVVPDLVRWRFPVKDGAPVKGVLDRWLVGRHSFRQAMERLWWRANMLRDPWSEDPWALMRGLMEDDFIALVERPHLVGHRPAVLALTRNILAAGEDDPSINRGLLMRHAARRLLRLGAVVDLHGLDADGLRGLMDEILVEARADLTGSRPAPSASPASNPHPQRKDDPPQAPAARPKASRQAAARMDQGFMLPEGEVDAAAIRRKLARICQGGEFRCIDLFSGCGGISLGMQMAGARMLAGMDIDMPSMRSWWYNLRREAGLHNQATVTTDVSALTAEEALHRLRSPEGADGIDLLVGGPPCQAYSRIGKGKLASLRDKEQAHLDDGRGLLFEEYLRFVRETAPLGLLIENVPDAINYGGKVIPAVICKALDDLGYHARFTVLNSACYGVPQTRERVFIIGIHKAASRGPVRFPTPTNRLVRDPDLRQARHRIVRVAEENPDWAELPPEAGPGLPEAVTVEDALSDLPVIKSLDRQGGRLGCAEMDGLLPYSSAARTPYQQLMRGWSGFSTSGHVTGNLLREVPRDFSIFARMKEGDQYPEARKIAEGLFLEEVARQRAAGQRIAEGDQRWRSLHRAMVPPYDDTKFESKWWKMRRDRPSRTVVAHLQMDTYSHIHFDGAQARAVTVREAARLQSFPDGFQFIGSMKEGFRQIGNAVPPLMACHLGRSLMDAIRAKT